MYYPSKRECYLDILMSLRVGVLHEIDLKSLMDYYREMEFYECCSGLAEAYAQFKKEQNEYFNTSETENGQGNS